MITTSTGAKKLESSDNWREIFPNPGTSAAGAHNASVDAQDRIQAEVAPIINGKQCALGAASGDYVLLRNSTIAGKSDGAYIAAKAIPAATDIDSTYLGSAITGGIVNELNGKITKIEPKGYFNSGNLKTIIHDLYSSRAEFPNITNITISDGVTAGFVTAMDAFIRIYPFNGTQLMLIEADKTDGTARYSRIYNFGSNAWGNEWQTR